jgi:molybdenum cofactor biosynthesis protein B
MGLHEHRGHAPGPLSVAVVSISTSRTLDEDKSGRWIAKQAAKEGHNVVYHQVIPDEAPVIARTALDLVERKKCQVILMTGGTGIADADVTIEAIRPLLDKEIPAFGVLFTQLSFEEIDSAALLSRATAGRIGKALVFCMPGSLNACKLACNNLIFPELGHLMKHVISG